MSSTYFFCHEHLKMVTIIELPTSLSPETLTDSLKRKGMNHRENESKYKNIESHSHVSVLD